MTPKMVLTRQSIRLCPKTMFEIIIKKKKQSLDYPPTAATRPSDVTVWV